MKKAGIRKFKAHLSSYLREVQAGETVLVTDRGRVVAELRQPEDQPTSLDPDEAAYRELVKSGLVIPAKKNPKDIQWIWEWKGPGLPKGTAQEILDADREDRW